MGLPDVIRRFRSLMERENDQINLAEAALVIASTEYPELTPEPWLACLHAIADSVKPASAPSPLANIAALNQVLFDQECFSGNDEEYDDPRNSYLNDVIKRKKGIPITLSVIYMEVARRCGMPVVGVGFPGHFLVKYLGTPTEILVDPYHRGAILTPADCAALLKAHLGPEAELKTEYTFAATNKQILARMLNNLKGSYFRRACYSKVLTLIELAFAINADSLASLRDRATIYVALARYGDALADLKTYLALSPTGDPEAREVLRTLHRVRSMLN